MWLVTNTTVTGDSVDFGQLVSSHRGVQAVFTGSLVSQGVMSQNQTKSIKHTEANKQTKTEETKVGGNEEVDFTSAMPCYSEKHIRVHNK